MQEPKTPFCMKVVLVIVLSSILFDVVESFIISEIVIHQLSFFLLVCVFLWIAQEPRIKRSVLFHFHVFFIRRLSVFNMQWCFCSTLTKCWLFLDLKCLKHLKKKRQIGQIDSWTLSCGWDIFLIIKIQFYGGNVSLSY